MEFRLFVASSIAFTLAAAAQSARRPEPPTRDPHSAGYVKAHELPDGAIPSPDRNGNFIVGPTHRPAPELAAFAAGDHTLHNGRAVEFTMTSAESRLYPGIAREPGTFGTPDPGNPARLDVPTSHPAPWKRTVNVYIPNAYKAGSEAAFIVGQDGPDSMLFAAIDALIPQHRIPAIVAISIQNGGGDAQGSERGLEYDTMSGRYAEWVESEVLPRVEKEAGIKLTHDPDGRAATGGSSGAACALIMAWYHPELYHRVLSWSGTYVNQQWPWNPATPHGAWAFHESLIPQSPRKPIRIWMQVGDRDLYNPNIMRDNMHDWVDANERMARVLAAKRYRYQFLFVRNAAHVDHDAKLQLYPEALEYVWRGYKEPGANDHKQGEQK
jgi:enterochelin esterase-like enzyme